MLSNRTFLFGLILTASTPLVLAAQVPVIDINSAAQNNAVQNKTSKVESFTLNEQLANIERKLDARNRYQVNIQHQLDDLHTQVNELRGVTELHANQLAQVLKRQRELYQELDRRVSEALKITAQASKTIAVNTSVTSQNYSDNLTENEAYDKALNLVLKDKQYEQAIPAFQYFNKTYPQSTYAANAHYWLGQLLFNKGQLNEAEKEFSIVVQKFKDSNKRPDALLKLAMVAQQKKAVKKAINLYRQLIDQYPASTSAKLAKPRLDKLIK